MRRGRARPLEATCSWAFLRGIGSFGVPRMHTLTALFLGGLVLGRARKRTATRSQERYWLLGGGSYSIAFSRAGRVVASQNCVPERSQDERGGHSRQQESAQACWLIRLQAQDFPISYLAHTPDNARLQLKLPRNRRLLVALSAYATICFPLPGP